MAGQWAIRASVRSGSAGRVERVAEADQRAVRRVRLGGGQARDPAAVRVAADRDVGLRRHGEVERRHRVLGLPARQVDRGRGDAAGAQALDERGHAGRRPAGAVSQVAAQAHGVSVPGAWVVRLRGSWPSRVMAGHGPAAAILVAYPHREDACRPSSSVADRHATRRRPSWSPSSRPSGGAAWGHRPASRGSVAGGRPDRDPDADRDPDPDGDRRPDGARGDGDVLRTRLRPRRRDVPVRRPRARAGRPGPRPPSSPTTTAGRPSARSPPPRGSASASSPAGSPGPSHRC